MWAGSGVVEHRLVRPQVEARTAARCGCDGHGCGVCLADEGGVGNAIFLTADKPLSILNGNKCKYAINFFNDRIFSKFRCDISNEAIKVLENLNK